jgi:hypothetical protein
MHEESYISGHIMIWHCPFVHTTEKKKGSIEQQISFCNKRRKGQWLSIKRKKITKEIAPYKNLVAWQSVCLSVCRQLEKSIGIYKVTGIDKGFLSTLNIV